MGRQVQSQGCLKCGEGQLVDPQSPQQRMLAQPRNNVGSPRDDPRLWPAEQLVARKHDQIDACFQNIRHHWFVPQTEGRQVNQHAAAQIFHQDQVPLCCQLRQSRA